MATDKTQVGILFGGVNSEHDISIISAQYLSTSIDTTRYLVSLIYLAQDGLWYLANWDDNMVVQIISKPLLIHPKTGCLCLSADDTSLELAVVFPCFHGLFGEDGCIQGLLESLQIPYVGSGVLASAIAMDKDMTKRAVSSLAIPTLPYHICCRDVLDDVPSLQHHCETMFAYPWFVKPANTGSSVGISKVKTPNEFESALREAFRYDDKVLIEQGLDKPRELEVALLGDTQNPTAMGCGEIIPNSEFYDYQAKYVNGTEELVVPAVLESDLTQTLQEYAEQIFRAIGCYGLARADFLLDVKTNQIYFSEINTIPGLTPISLFPLLCAEYGLAGANWIDQLLQLALKRYTHRQQNILLNYENTTLSS